MIGSFGQAQFGDAIDDLAACVDQPLECRDPASFRVLLGKLFDTPPTSRVLNLLAKGLVQGVGGCRAGGGAPDDPFCALPAVVLNAFRVHAKANPDVAVILLLQVIDAALRDDFHAQINQGPDGVFAHAFTVIVENLPKTLVPDTRTRAVLLLKTLSDLTTLPDTAQHARTALMQIAEQLLPQPPSPQPPSPPAAPNRQRTIVFVAGSIIAIGGIAFLFWRFTRRPASALSAGRLRRRATSRSPKCRTIDDRRSFRMLLQRT